MRRLLLVAVLLAGCSHKEDKLAQARRSADEARAAASKAEAEAAEAERQLEHAVAEQKAALASKQDLERQLAEARAQTAEVVELAKKKITALQEERKTASAARRTEIDHQIEQLSKALEDAGSAQSPP